MKRAVWALQVRRGSRRGDGTGSDEVAVLSVIANSQRQSSASCQLPRVSVESECHFVDKI